MISKCNPSWTAVLLVSSKPFQSIWFTQIYAGIKIHSTMFWRSLIQINNTKKSYKISESYFRGGEMERNREQWEFCKQEKQATGSNFIHKFTLWHIHLRECLRDIYLLSYSVKLKWSGKRLQTCNHLACLQSHRDVSCSEPPTATFKGPLPSTPLVFYLKFWDP